MACNKTKKNGSNNKSGKTNIFFRLLIFTISMLLLPVIVIGIVSTLFGYIVFDNNNIMNQVSTWILSVGKSINENKECVDCDESGLESENG